MPIPCSQPLASTTVRIHFCSSGTRFVALRYSSHSKRIQQATVAESLAIPSSESMTAVIVLMVSIYFQSPPPPTPRRPSDGVSRTQAATLLVRSRLSGRGYLSLTQSPWDVLTQSGRLWTDHQVASVLLLPSPLCCDTQCGAWAWAWLREVVGRPSRLPWAP